mmetsp:Transcript_73110/g.200743  ORF Transcript_73110/g.200743 Transcript_73110/m.200743 type:complete len:154 (-) Transcript_73110:7-468(-)
MLFFSCACMRIALARKSAFCSCFIQFHVLLPVSFITSGHRRIPARVILHCVHRFPFMQLLCTTHVRIDTLIIAFHLPPSRVRAFVLVPLRLFPSSFIPAASSKPSLASFILLFHALFLSFCFLLHIWSAFSHSSLASLHAAALYPTHTHAHLH